MRALIQRVARAQVSVDGAVRARIAHGLVVFLGVKDGDDRSAGDWLARKIAGLRIFADDAERMNRDVREVGGGALVVPQFTLYGDARRGHRPDFTAAARPEAAEPIFDSFCAALESHGVVVERGVFRAHMQVDLTNDGPVTIWIETPGSEPAD